MTASFIVAQTSASLLSAASKSSAWPEGSFQLGRTTPPLFQVLCPETAGALHVLLVWEAASLRTEFAQFVIAMDGRVPLSPWHNRIMALCEQCRLRARS